VANQSSVSLKDKATFISAPTKKFRLLHLKVTLPVIHSLWLSYGLDFQKSLKKSWFLIPSHFN